MYQAQGWLQARSGDRDDQIYKAEHKYETLQVASTMGMTMENVLCPVSALYILCSQHILINLATFECQ